MARGRARPRDRPFGARRSPVQATGQRVPVRSLAASLVRRILGAIALAVPSAEAFGNFSDA